MSSTDMDAASAVHALLATEPSLGVKAIAKRLSLSCKDVRDALQAVPRNEEDGGAAGRGAEAAGASSCAPRPEDWLPAAPFQPLGPCGLCQRPLSWDWTKRDYSVCCRTMMCTDCLDTTDDCPKCHSSLAWADHLAKSLQPLVVEGDPRAQACLGTFHRDGTYGAKRDLRRAVELFELSADQGNTDAAVRLADILLGLDASHNKKVPKDKPRGLRLTLLAAQAGDALAQFNMAFMIERGEHGLTTNLIDAMEWYRKAAKSGHARAQARVGIARLEGKATTGVMSSQVEAHKQLLEAAEGGAPDAMELLGARYCELRKDIYPPADAELALKWLTRALDARLKGGRDPEALATGVKHDHEKAAVRLLKAIGDVHSWKGEPLGSEPNFALARSFYKRALDLDPEHESAASNLKRLTVLRDGYEKFIATAPPDMMMTEEFFKKTLDFGMSQGESNAAARAFEARQAFLKQASAAECAHCQKKGGGLEKCERCKCVYYCSQECQLAHWRQHKKECKQLEAEKWVQGIKQAKTVEEFDKALGLR